MAEICKLNQLRVSEVAPKRVEIDVNRCFVLEMICLEVAFEETGNCGGIGITDGRLVRIPTVPAKRHPAVPREFRGNSRVRIAVSFQHSSPISPEPNEDGWRGDGV